MLDGRDGHYHQLTKCVNQIVVVRKSNGDVGIGLNPVGLNKAVKREHYPLITVDWEVATSMSEAKVFSTLDATSVMYQIKLAEESTWLTAFNTPFGRLNLRVCQLVWYSPQTFFKGPWLRCLKTSRNAKSFLMICYFVAGGKNTEDHDHTLKQVLKRAAENDSDLMSRYKKCKFYNSVAWSVLRVR